MANFEIPTKDDVREIIREENKQILDALEQLNNKSLANEYLTIDEVATMLKKTRQTIHNWSARGILTKVYLTPGQPLFKRSEIEARLSSK